jgi:Dolichyl-phosphate-mannose-protein mannosyltransferase
MRGERPVALLVFAAALAFYTLTAGGSLTSTDAVVTFDLTRSIVEHRSLALSGNLLGSEQNRGVDGRYYSQWGLGHSLYNVPFYVAGKMAAALLGRPVGKPDTIPKAAVALGSAAAGAGAVCFIWLLAFRMTGHARAALVAALSAAVASPLWPYSRFGFSTALTAMILTAAAWLLWLAAERGRAAEAAAAGGVVAFGWLTRHEMALAIAPFALFLVISARRRRLPAADLARQAGAFAGCAAVGGILWLLYNVVRFGSATQVGYTPAFGTEGYAAFLVAPGGSVVLFCPIALLWAVGVWRARRAAPVAPFLLAGPLLAFYGFFGALADWPGGRSYGPRYLVSSLILLAPGAALLWAHGGRRVRQTVAGAILVAAVLQLPGVLVDYSKVSVAWARAATEEQVAARNWRMSSSPLVLNARDAIRRVPENARYLTGRSSPPPVRDAFDRDFSQQFSYSLDFWWLYLHYFGVLSAAAAVGIAMALLATATALAVAAWRRAGP